MLGGEESIPLFYDLVEQGVQLFGGGRTYRLEYWTLIGDAINPAFLLIILQPSQLL